MASSHHQSFVRQDGQNDISTSSGNTRLDENSITSTSKSNSESRSRRGNDILQNESEPDQYGSQTRNYRMGQTYLSSHDSKPTRDYNTADYGLAKAEKGTSEVSEPVGFWHSSLTKIRNEVFMDYLKILLILCLFILSIMSLYWGVLFKLRANLPRVTIGVVNFDSQLPPYDTTVPLVGPAVTKATEAELLKPQHLGFITQSPSEYNNDPFAVRLAVHEEHLWAAIIVNNNATALLRQAVETGNRSYEPLGAAQIIYNEARDQESYSQYITPVLNQLTIEIGSSFGSRWTESVLKNMSLDPKIYSQVPQALSPAIGFSMFNLRPFTPPTTTPAVSVGLIYLIIVAFFSFSFFIPIHTKFTPPNPPPDRPKLKYYQLILWRYIASITSYFFLSLSYSLVSLAFLIPFSNTASNGSDSWSKTEVISNADDLGRATFFIFWMLNFIGMSALGLACENVAMIIGTPWTAFWLIFWVITNVSTAFYSVELAPDFYRWGYAWPLHQIVYASRTLLFSTHNRLGLNFGILFIWIVISTVLFPFCCYFMRWKEEKEAKKD